MCILLIDVRMGFRFLGGFFLMTVWYSTAKHLILGKVGVCFFLMAFAYSYTYIALARQVEKKQFVRTRKLIF